MALLVGERRPVSVFDRHPKRPPPWRDAYEAGGEALHFHVMLGAAAEPLGFSCKASAGGAVVVHVERGGAGEKAGIKTGLNVVNMNNVPVRTAEDLLEARRLALAQNECVISVLATTHMPEVPVLSAPQAVAVRHMDSAHPPPRRASEAIRQPHIHPSGASSLDPLRSLQLANVQDVLKRVSTHDDGRLGAAAVSTHTNPSHSLRKIRHSGDLPYRDDTPFPPLEPGLPSAPVLASGRV
eukprot:TRINITY_DN20986_c0_g1_i1.p1 TRINITY_DN20986_c0_g1~~TRINITY_DN20986_c0_g1_i1.p1  ORF type:complete len:254 (+),score=67.23 TRINITY_DN20986_c0_g1_i1:48-764(+)